MTTRLWMAALGAAMLAACASSPTDSNPVKPPPVFDAGPAVTIVEPFNGASVKSPFKVRFAVSGMTVAPAGTMTEKTGHHHLLINLDSLAAGAPVPFDDRHMHFGAGQTETMVTLPPGTYKLTAQFANGAHLSYGQSMSHSIAVTVTP